MQIARKESTGKKEKEVWRQGSGMLSVRRCGRQFCKSVCRCVFSCVLHICAGCQYLFHGNTVPDRNFTNVSGFADFWKHTWVCFAYIAYGMCYTGASMPYGSLATVITSDPVENAKLSRARSFGGAIVGILLSLVPQFIYDKDTNPVPMAFFVIAVIFGLGSILAYTILLSGSTERIHYEVKKDTYKYSEVLPWHLLLPSIPWG